MGVKQRLTNDAQDGTKKSLDKRLILNVGGGRHETWVSTLETFPGTRLALLAHLQESDENYDEETQEYFFDRHPQAFQSIIHYYRCNELHFDQGVCGNVLKGELEFWGIEEHEIEPCCWSSYSRYTEHKETLRELDDNFAYVDSEAWGETKTKWQQFCSATWKFLEEPGSSRWAKMYAVISMFFVTLSIATFVFETHSLFQIDEYTGRPMSEINPDIEDETPTGGKLTCCCDNPIANNATTNPVPHQALVIVDYICISFFTLELILRFGFAPSKCRFWRHILNIIDLICLLPHFAAIIVRETTSHDYAAQILRIIMMMRIIRILRIFKLMKHYNAFKILVYTIKVSTKELLLMIVFLMSGVLMFASIIHYVEKHNFPNIPIGIWWALVTMTTVGYGDKYPVGYLGYLVSSVCVICGVLVIAFTVPIVVNNFSLYYSHAQTRIKVPNKKRRDFKEKVRITTLRRHNDISKKPHDKHDKFDEIESSSRENSVTNSREQLVKKENNNNKPQRESRDNKPQNKPIRSREVKRGTSRDKLIHNTGHGSTPSTPGAPTPLTSRDVELEDIDSLDSGFTDETKAHKRQQAKHEEEAQRIMDKLKDSDTKFSDERKRQEYLIQQKRERRIQERRKKGDTESERSHSERSSEAKQKY